MLFCPGPAVGSEGQIRAGLGRTGDGRQGRGRTTGAGTRRTALKRRAWRGPSGLRALAQLGAVAARYKGTVGRAGCEAGHKGGSRVLRALCRPHKAVPAPAPSELNSGRPAARAGSQLLHICTEAGRAPRSGGLPHPRPGSGAARAAGQFVL